MDSFCYNCKRQKRLCINQRTFLDVFESLTMMNDNNVRVCRRCHHLVEDHFDASKYNVYIQSLRMQ